jgi:hypothetical protein
MLSEPDWGADAHGAGREPSEGQGTDGRTVAQSLVARGCANQSKRGVGPLIHGSPATATLAQGVACGAILPTCQRRLVCSLLADGMTA